MLFLCIHSLSNYQKKWIQVKWTRDTLREIFVDKRMKDRPDEIKFSVSGLNGNNNGWVIVFVHDNNQLSCKHARTCQNHSVLANFENFIFKNRFKVKRVSVYFIWNMMILEGCPRCKLQIDRKSLEQTPCFSIKTEFQRKKTIHHLQIQKSDIGNLKNWDKKST